MPVRDSAAEPAPVREQAAVRESAGARKLGRPRSPDVDRAIITATLELIAAEGVNGPTVEDVAASARVGKATIYRRWSSREALIGDALATLNDDLPEAYTATHVRGQVRELLDHLLNWGGESLSNRIFPRMVGCRNSHPEQFAIFRARVLEPRRQRLREVLQGGIDRGELRPGIDLEVVATALYAPLVHLNAYGLVTPDVDVVEALLDVIFDGIACR